MVARLFGVVGHLRGVVDALQIEGELEETLSKPSGSPWMRLRQSKGSKKGVLVVHSLSVDGAVLLLLRRLESRVSLRRSDTSERLSESDLLHS